MSRDVTVKLTVELELQDVVENDLALLAWAGELIESVLLARGLPVVDVTADEVVAGTPGPPLLPHSHVVCSACEAGKTSEGDDCKACSGTGTVGIRLPGLAGADLHGWLSRGMR